MVLITRKVPLLTMLFLRRLRRLGYKLKDFPPKVPEQENCQRSV